jgi:Flp pilus assembly protein CpaB
MKPKTLILLVVAVTCGLGASYMTSRLLAERQTDDTEKVAVLVAKKNLDMGLTIKKVEDFFEEKKFTKGDEPKNAIVKLEDLQARVLKRSLRGGDFVTGDDLLSDKDGGISTLMAQGYRAIGIRVNIADIASGFASLPMSRVDLIWTVRRATDKDSSSRILLENVLVLAADTQTTRVEGSGAMPASVVTVALKPEDILKVSMARELGTISMVLRKFNDHQKAEVSTVTVEELVTGTAGRKETEDDSWVESTGQPAIAKVQLPELPKDIQPVDVAKVEKGTLHRMRLIEGDRERVVEYWLDDNGEVIHNDVVRSEIAPAPPRPPQVQPPQAQPRQPASPPPATPPAPSPSAPNGHKV